jgi:hypothetical protein
MNVKIIFDVEENEYIAFIDGISSINGYGATEKDAIIDFLRQCEDNPSFNQTIVKLLLDQKL